MPKYAFYDPTSPSPHPVEGWIDTDRLNYPSLPPREMLLQVSEAEWTAHWNNHMGFRVVGGRLVELEGTRPKSRPPAPRFLGRPELG